MLPGLDALPSLNLSGGHAYGGSQDFGGITFHAPARGQGSAQTLLLIGGILAAVYFLRGK